MATIAIYADALSAETSSVPSREMLLQLTRLRAGDHFIFVLFNGSEKSGWWCSFKDRLAPEVSWSEYILPVTRRRTHLFVLMGSRFQPEADVKANVYVRLDVGTMGRSSRPLIQLVADLSAIMIGDRSSLKWHGRALFRRYLRDGAQLASRTVCISQTTARDVAEALPQLKDRLVVIPNGIADAWLSIPDGTGPAADADARSHFLWYGHFSPRKNLERLLLAYACFAQTGGQQDLVLVSSGAERLRPHVDSLGLSGRVRLQDPTPLADLIHLASQSDGVLLPSLHEGFGMPIIEAFARGVPVLTSDRSAMPETAGGLAVLCDPEDTRSMADGLVALARPEQWAATAVVARRAHAGKFTSEAAARRYSALIDEMLHEAMSAGRRAA